MIIAIIEVTNRPSINSGIYIQTHYCFLPMCFIQLDSPASNWRRQ